MITLCVILSVYFYWKSNLIKMINIELFYVTKPQYTLSLGTDNLASVELLLL